MMMAIMVMMARSESWNKFDFTLVVAGIVGIVFKVRAH